MNNRLFTHVILAGAFFAAASHAESCKEITLYDGSAFNGHMEESGRTFPEAPEWVTNWGDFENMKSPYIRLSGTKNMKSDWKGALVMDALPLKLNGGQVNLKVRSSQSGKFGVWLSGASGTSRAHFENIEANKTHVVSVPLAEIYDGEAFSLEKFWIGLFDVPTYQYTNLFVDDISVSCAESQSSENTGESAGLDFPDEDGEETFGADVNLSYEYSDVVASSPEREKLYLEEQVPSTKARYSSLEQNQLMQQTSNKFVLNWTDHQQILTFLRGEKKNAKKSREGWYNGMYLVERGRLQDNVIANPKNIFLEADAMAASFEMQKMPLLLADLDYGYKTCRDTACATAVINDYHLLMAGLPSSYTNMSKVTIFYDPYFVVTTRDALPDVEICTSKGCHVLKPKTEQVVEFESAGLQTITVKMKSGTTSIQQTLYMEVK